MRALATGPTVILVPMVAIVVSVRAAPSLANATCTDCHSDAVDSKRFQASVHKGLACVACHAGIVPTDDGHEKPARVECARCHPGVGEKVAASAHGGRAPVACGPCHGSHYIERRGANGHLKSMEEEKCGACHAKAAREYHGGFHGRSSNEHVAVCSDCHGTHEILSHSDSRSATFRLNLASTCGACHSNPVLFDETHITAVKGYFGSDHGVAISRGGLLVAATCPDCHGAHTVTRAGSGDSARAHIPATCGKCHGGVLALYMESAHGKPFKDGNTDVPVCTDCHRAHTIRSPLESGSSVHPTAVSATCLKCHEDQAVVSRYGFPGLQGENYRKSYHGAAARLGDSKVANCASCHGSHDIRRSADPKAATNPANLGLTCGKCHEMGSIDLSALEKVHVSLAQGEHHVTRVVKWAYLALISGVMGFFLFYIAIDLRKRLAGRRQG